MTVDPQLVDLLRAEIRRQASHAAINVAPSRRPDHIHVMGDLDLYELARAIAEALS